MNEVTKDHSSMIIGGLAAVALSLFAGDKGLHFNPSDGTLWVGVGAVLHGFGVNIPILDNILGSIGSLFAKK